MDISGGINRLLQNKLLMQYLSGAGGAMAAGQPIAPALSQITQQNIGAQSQAALNKRYMDMIGKMLSGKEVPAGGKVTHDEKGTKLEIPKDSGFSTMPGSAQLGNINPFSPSQPGVSAADLAGLGPQDVSRALASAVNVEALKQRTIAESTRAGAREPLEEQFPVELPGIGKITLRQWQSLPQDEREYALFVHESKRLGDTDIMTRREFEMLEPTERERFVRAAMKDPKVMAGAKELAVSGATRISIGEKVAEKKALGKLKGQLYFSDPKWIDDISGHLGGEDIQRRIFMESQKEGADPGLIKAEEAIRFIEGKISVGGTIQDVRLSEDGKTMIWTVKWKSGDVEDISYVVRP